MAALICVPVIISATYGKSAIDEESYRSWPSIKHPEISNDGKYAIYEVASQNAAAKLVAASTDNGWNKEILDVKLGRITDDSNYLVCSTASRHLVILKLGSDEGREIKNVASFMVPASGGGHWLAYQEEGKAKDLVLTNLRNNSSARYEHVETYTFNPQGTALLMFSSKNSIAGEESHLVWLSLPEQKSFEIMRNGNVPTAIAFDSSGTQLAFQMKASDAESINDEVLMYYRLGTMTAVCKVNSSTAGMKGIRITTSWTQALMFSPDDKMILFSTAKCQEESPQKTGIVASKTILWNSSDKILKSRREASAERMHQDRNSQLGRMTVIGVNSGDKMIRVQIEGDDDDKVQCAGWEMGGYALVHDGDMRSNETYWIPELQPDCYLVSLYNGLRTRIVKHVFPWHNEISLSPSGKSVVWFDQASKNYFSRETSNGVIHNITHSIRTKWEDDENDEPLPPKIAGIAAWSKDGDVLIYDRYDIWKVDPMGLRAPTNQTGGYGRRNGIVLRYLSFENENGSAAVVDTNALLWLTGFDQVNKDSGFFKIEPDRKRLPIKMDMGPYVYLNDRFQTGASGISVVAQSPIKARDVNTYLVSRMSDRDSPNLLITHDFGSFTQLSNVHPERAYNGWSAELLHYKRTKDRQGEALLFKPEDFDPTKKYPVIVVIYEKQANGLHLFLAPKPTDGQLDIPTFVSHGFLVCVPDIYYSVGHPGESALGSVSSAVARLCEEPFVERSKIGIQGHSFGGYETNYIVAHSNIFAAAAPAAAICDLISHYDSVRFPTKLGESDQFLSEMGQTRMGATLWEAPDLYIKNSPIFDADKVSTPLLIMHGGKDTNVHWEQGLEWYLALRRLGKTAWLLEYPEEAHQLVDNATQLDYSKRLREFFDHYLRGAQTPAWMTTSDDARDKREDVTAK